MPASPAMSFRHASADAPPQVLVIAELGVNHDGQLDRAMALVEAAREAGADAIKLQLFRASTLLSNQAKLAAYQENAAADPVQLLSNLSLDVDEMAKLKALAHAAGLGFILTPFSLEDLPDLKAIEVDAVKIASPDAVNAPLLSGAAAVGKPMLVSTGTCELAELEPAAAMLKRHAPGAALMQCVSSYPTPDQQASLGGIVALRERFGLPVGYSDHTQSIEVPAFAVFAGACVIEKHLTWSRDAEGPDHAASLDPAQFAAMVKGVRRAERMLGPKHKAMLEIEADVKHVSRQSVCAARTLEAGHVLTREDLTLRRPGTGIPAAELDATIGKTLSAGKDRGDLISPEDVSS